MSKENKEQFVIRSREYEHEPTSHEKWFEIWINIAKKELLDHFQQETSNKKD
ncbi:hypothetical protein AWH56_002930 [Anaerobacillus isosaccharinicus]|uniref:Uncharacterized protein n=1 Tax=Anaerobacillus isosaccharinicus TaxID=1532552 RepID=A0A7S7L8Y3_9BACI|nr:hypothetical protein [Anaerobacillus isosaccharinicus]MBA5585003.1 hypothetical protein [Anaerobacillus isosaccharinicus]QOY36644.1 hypothetical protein AWH56_002930 [Anaerobacillus isosaccharinicus]